MEELLSWSAIISLLTLTVMEIVLGIDNIVFISIIVSKLPQEKQKKARNIGLILALIPRILLLLIISWITQWDKPLFTLDIPGNEDLEMSGKGLILLIGGIFLIYKSTTEIHHKLEGTDEVQAIKTKAISFTNVIIQICILNIVFSFDSILTAVGLANHVSIMIIAVVISIILMILFSGYVSTFINNHPTIKVLALAFLLMIGLLLVLEGFDIHVPKGYVYFAMAFSITVEILNLKMRKSANPVKLHNKALDEKKKIDASKFKF